MPDACFDDPRLAEVYDHFDDDRRDLDTYAALADEFGARTVVDIGCGTGTFACLLAARGLNVVGVDPAAASLAIAQRKAHSELVRWLEGDASILPRLSADMVTMTGNVAQVFLTDDGWRGTLQNARQALAPGGKLVFETRNPECRAWETWTTRQAKLVEVPNIGTVEFTRELTAVDLPLVSFREKFVFRSDGAVITSDSTLRFRTTAEIEASLADVGFQVEEVRDAPDRPGLEFVFVATVARSPASV